MPMPRREPEERVCPVCGVVFLVGGRGRPSPRQKLCSVGCQRASRFRNGVKASELTDVDRAYLAGLIDGEGSVMLVARETGSVHIRLAISNTDRPLLEWVLATAAIGAVYQHRDASAQHKAAYSWRSHGDGAASVLGQVRPYLRVKRRQADLAITHHETLRDPAKKADRSWQQANLLAMKAMNRRGGSVA